MVLGTVFTDMDQTIAHHHCQCWGSSFEYESVSGTYQLAMDGVEVIPSSNSIYIGWSLAGGMDRGRDFARVLPCALRSRASGTSPNIYSYSDINNDCDYDRPFGKDDTHLFLLDDKTHTGISSFLVDGGYNNDCEIIPK